eukprot:scaffold62336_cov69-Phaeocystis_antarctica.AAC.6
MPCPRQGSNVSVADTCLLVWDSCLLVWGSSPVWHTRSLPDAFFWPRPPPPPPPPPPFLPGLAASFAAGSRDTVVPFAPPAARLPLPCRRPPTRSRRPRQQQRSRPSATAAKSRLPSAPLTRGMCACSSVAVTACPRRGSHA